MQDQLESHYRRIESDNTFIMHIKKTYLELGAKGVKTDEVDAILKFAVRFMPHQQTLIFRIFSHSEL